MHHERDARAGQAQCHRLTHDAETDEADEPHDAPSVREAHARVRTRRKPIGEGSRKPNEGGMKPEAQWGGKWSKEYDSRHSSPDHDSRHRVGPEHDGT
ncbi:hypothetical protein RGQ21_12660 [Kitasatospora aureofaciens]|nr:hypothetical protein RGQ21_12660 [Kitasatospora aureofaciens]